MALLACQNVSLKYDANVIVRDINFSVNAGDYLCVVGENGSSYLLDMGQPVKITELAEQIIRFSGFEPYKDIDIVFTGARKGERAIEPLRLPEEEAQKTSYKKIMRLKNTPYAEAHLRSLLEKLYPVCFRTSGEEEKYRNKQYLLSVLSEDVPSLKAFYAEVNRG